MSEDPRDARIAELETELAGWQRVAVEAVIPLEAMVASGTMKLHSTMTQTEIVNAVTVVRRAVSGKGLPSRAQSRP